MLGHKKCAKCGLKPISEFYKRYDKPHLLQSLCKECEILKNKNWCKENKDKRKEYKRLYEANRFNNDILFKLKKNLRSRINRAIKKEYRSGSAIQQLDCSINDLKKHLESQFLPGMTWETHGVKGWHIDHIIPLDSFDLTNPEELKKACHYTNLQPLWWEDNTFKGNKV